MSARDYTPPDYTSTPKRDDEELLELVDLVQCRQRTNDPGFRCKGEPEFFIHWPGVKPLGTCRSHTLWAIKVAKAMGFKLFISRFSLPAAKAMKDGQPYTVTMFDPSEEDTI